MAVLTREEKAFLEALPKALYAISDSINRVADVLGRSGQKPTRDAQGLRIDTYKRFKNHRKENVNECQGTVKGTDCHAQGEDAK